jgi:ribA/ribD-fused uncharacterized protein
MPASVAELQAQIALGFEPDFLFFWGHTPQPRQTHVGRECLSQWYPSRFVVDGIAFATAEHFMMQRKALLFADAATAARIIEAPHPGEAKALGRAVRGFDEGVWKRERLEIVVAGNLAKFSQNPMLRAFLLSTKECVLVESSPRDAIWGIGVSESDPAARLPLQWRGLNLLGFALMRVRASLRPLVPLVV